MNVLPAPGAMWSLGDPQGGASEAVGDMGVFCLSGPGAQEEVSETTAQILKNRGEWILLPSNIMGREGRVYPVDEVLEVLKGMRVRSSLFFSILDVPLTDTGNGPRIDLLVFTGGKKGMDEAVLISKTREHIATEMGEEFQPDRIVFFPLYPRFLSDTEVDHDWCRSQYLIGGLFRRSRDDIFDCITRLRGWSLNGN